MRDKILRASFVLWLALVLTACGSGSDSSAVGPGRVPGAGPGDPGSPTGTVPDDDDGEAPPGPDLSGLYHGWGLMPARLDGRLSFDSAAAPAVAPGYLLLGSLQPVTDIRLNMQNFEWSLRELVRRAVAEGGVLQEELSPYRVSCDLREPATDEGYPGIGYALIHYRQDYADGRLDEGEEVVFTLEGCQPAGGMQAMSSELPLHLIYGEQRYRFSGLALSSYDGMRLDSSGWLTRRDLEEAHRYSEQTPRCAEMVLVNQGPDGAPSELAIVQTGAEAPLRIRFWHDGVQVRPGSIETFVEPAHPALTFLPIEAIHVHFDPGALGDPALAGTYVLRMQETTGLALQYNHGSFATSPFRLFGGGFSVETPDGVVYRYRVAADPAYVEVWQGEGTAGEYLGTVAQALLAQRLKLVAPLP